MALFFNPPFPKEMGAISGGYRPSPLLGATPLNPIPIGGYAPQPHFGISRFIDCPVYYQFAAVFSEYTGEQLSILTIYSSESISAVRTAFQPTLALWFSGSSP